jgi:hypothetical protein
MMFTILISLGVMAGLAKPQPETVVVNTPYGSYVTTTYVSFANIAPGGRGIGIRFLIFIISFVLMFMYSSGLIYVGAKNRLWMLLAGGIIFLMSTIGLLILMITS